MLLFFSRLYQSDRSTFFPHTNATGHTRYFWLLFWINLGLISLPSSAQSSLTINRSGWQDVLVAPNTPTVSGQSSLQRTPTAGQWYRVDTHVHSAFSSDAVADLGIISQAQEFGYNAIFVSDHTGASSFQINQLTSNYMLFEDSYARWEDETFGVVDASINELSSTPVNSGAYALHLQSQSSSYGESFITTVRGPNFRSGTILLKFSVYPTRIDPGSGIYVSVAIGGDPSATEAPTGYTTEDGVIRPNKSVVFVWQLGTPRQTSTAPDRRVYAYGVGDYTLNAWNHYTINISDYLQALPAAERPVSYNGLVDIKIAAAAKAGSVDGYVDSFSLIASTPVPPATEFLYRSSIIDQFNTPSFKLFPAYEMGQQKHAQRLSFGITRTVDYITYTYGSDGIGDVQASGYPVILNHPDVTVTYTETIATAAFGADLLEVRQAAWISIWDQILQGGNDLLGIWSSDAHTGLGVGKPAAMLFARSLAFDDLMRVLYEGRFYNADNNFTGHLFFGPEPNQAEPYPARYPIFISDTASEFPAHFTITGGLTNRHAIHWIQDGQLIAIDQAQSDTYQASKTIDLPQTATYVRAEVLTGNGELQAITQPLFIRRVVGLPVGWRFGITAVETADGRGYTNQQVKGIRAARWSNTSQILEVQLDNPPAAMTYLALAIPVAPQRILVNGVVVPLADNTQHVRSAHHSSWFYEKSTGALKIAIDQTARRTWLTIDFSVKGDQEAPTIPSQPTAIAQQLGQVELRWAPAVDNTGVQGYTIYRNQQRLALVEGTEQRYVDIHVKPNTAYAYTIAAFDGANNDSAPSSAVTLVTPSFGIFSLAPVADTYVSADAAQSSFGGSVMLRVDGDPATISYLRFTPQAVIGKPQRALLRLYAQSGGAHGCLIHPIIAGAWAEGTTTYETAPTIGAELATSGPILPASWVEVDVTPLLGASGPIELALTTTGDTALRFAGREAGLLAPQLLVETLADLPPDFFTHWVYLALIAR